MIQTEFFKFAFHTEYFLKESNLLYILSVLFIREKFGNKISVLIILFMEVAIKMHIYLNQKDVTHYCNKLKILWLQNSNWENLVKNFSGGLVDITNKAWRKMHLSHPLKSGKLSCDYQYWLYLPLKKFIKKHRSLSP